MPTAAAGRHACKCGSEAISVDVTVAIDCMGGDHGPHVTVPAAIDYLRRVEDVNVILVGLQDAVTAELHKLKAANEPRLVVQHASEV